MKTKILIVSLMLGVLLATVANIGISIGLFAESDNPITLTIGPRTAEAVTIPDYIVDGVADEVQAQMALNALPAAGGKIVFEAFNYNFTTNATRAVNNVTIEGMGAGSYFANNGVAALFVAGGNNWKFQDIKTDAGGINMGATTQWYWENVNDGTNYYQHRSPGGAMEIGSLTVGATTYSTVKQTSGAGLISHIFNGGKLALWDTVTQGNPPLNPNDSAPFGLNLYGDYLAGDFFSWTQTNAAGVPVDVGLQVGRRVGATLSTIQATRIWSHKNANTDGTGGAFIELYNDLAGAVSSGRIDLYAFGQGTGADANRIRFLVRSGVDTASELLHFRGDLGNTYIEGGTWQEMFIVSKHAAGRLVFDSNRTAANQGTGLLLRTYDGTNTIADRVAIQSGVASANVTWGATQHVNFSLGGYMTLFRTDTDGSSTAQLWYDESEGALKFYDGAIVRTIAVVP